MWMKEGWWGPLIATREICEVEKRRGRFCPVVAMNGCLIMFFFLLFAGMMWSLIILIRVYLNFKLVIYYEIFIIFLLSHIFKLS